MPPFWREPWVVWVEVILLIMVVYLIFKYRTYRLRKDKRNLEEVVDKRTHEIARQKDKLEQFAANLEEKVNQRTTELKMAKQNAEESDRLKSAFLSNMSHEIRTPMNAILGFSELLSSPGFDEEERLGFAKMVKTNGDALLTLLNDIIDISMIESGQLKLNIVDVNIYNLVNNVYLVFKSSPLLSEKSGVSLDMSVKDDSGVIIKTDSQRLLQILNNLVGNALKFTDRGFVEIGYILKDREVLFFVKDTGIGISDEGLNRIFDRFHKHTGESKNIYGGNGLGLTISKNLVEALNGKIWVESTEGIGTAFYFSLPM
jgi:signal transduction histidine kinase